MKSAHDLVADAKARISEVDITEVDEAIRQADILVDVREADEFNQGHIPGAVNIPRGIVEFRFSSAPELEGRELNVLLYCKTSGRGALSACALKDMGYLNVHSIAGGFDAWLAADRPVAKPPSPDFD